MPIEWNTLFLWFQYQPFISFLCDCMFVDMKVIVYPRLNLNWWFSYLSLLKCWACVSHYVIPSFILFIQIFIAFITRAYVCTWVCVHECVSMVCVCRGQWSWFFSSTICILVIKLTRLGLVTKPFPGWHTEIISPAPPPFFWDGITCGLSWLWS